MKAAGDRWRRVEALYHEISSRPVDEQAAAVAAACADDPSLAAEVQSLLDQEPAGVFAVAALEAVAGAVSGTRTSLTGQRLGAFEVRGLLGVGGMGEVYRARDTKLGRDVAIKVLPSVFAHNDGKLSRFNREAHALASLNHPNIAAIYGIEDLPAASGEDRGSRALVMELVEGEDLSARITRGPLPVTETLRVARQIAAALQAAHERGIVHRDLKPANIKVRGDGTVKVLDFGLAKLQPEAPESANERTGTPVAVTGDGAVMGTPGYMSPEQIRGQSVDWRSDIFSFGVVLYEMLSGRRPFRKNSGVETLHATLEEEPPELSSLGRTIPPALDHLVRRCLAREPPARWQSASDLAAQLEWMSTESAARKDPKSRLRDIADAWELLDAEHVEGEASARTQRSRSSWFAWIAACVMGAAALVFAVLWLRPLPLPRVMRFEIHAPPGAILPVGTPAISPDGSTLAYVVQGADGITRLHVRPIDVIETRVLPETEGAVHPIWSTDGRSLAFVSGSSLKRIELARGTPRDLMKVTGPWQVAWNQHGDILGLGLQTMIRGSDQGGAPTPVEGGTRDTFPAFLSDGRRFLVRQLNDKGSSIRLGTLGSDKRTAVLDNVLSAPILAPTPRGKVYLLFLRDADLMAQEFNESAGTVVGSSVVLMRHIGRVADPSVMPAVSVSAAGILAYQSADEASIGQLIWLDRSGRSLEALSEDVSVLDPTLSPDNLFVAGERATGGRDVWVTDLRRKTTARITFDDALDSSAVWSADGKRIAFSRSGKGILAVDAQGGGTPELLASVTGIPLSWSPDRQSLLYLHSYPGKVALLELSGAKKATSIGAGNAGVSSARFSPDGKSIAFASNETGRSEVFIQATPPRSGRVQVSVKGGGVPRWGRDGKELFFISSDGMMTVADVTTGENYSASMPRELFKFSGKGGFDVTKDGQRFLILSPPKEVDTPITVVLNWWADLEQVPR